MNDNSKQIRINAVSLTGTTACRKGVRNVADRPLISILGWRIKLVIISGGSQRPNYLFTSFAETHGTNIMWKILAFMGDNIEKKPIELVFFQFSMNSRHQLKKISSKQINHGPSRHHFSATTCKSQSRGITSPLGKSKWDLFAAIWRT